MSRKVLGRIIVCALALAMVLGLCTMGSLADDGWSATITSDNASGVIGRDITVTVKGGSTVGTYVLNIPSGSGYTLSANQVTVSENKTTSFTIRPTVAGAGTVTISADTTSGVATGSKTISFNSSTPVLKFKNSSSAVYNADDNSFTVAVDYAAKNNLGSLKVETDTATYPKSSVKRIDGNTITVQGVGAYTVKYVDSAGADLASPIIYNVTKQKAVFAVSNQNLTLTVGESETLDYETTTDGDGLTNGTSGSCTYEYDKTNKTVKITAPSTAGVYTCTLADKGDDNYSESNPIGITVNALASGSPIIKVTPNYIKLDKDTSSKKVTVKITNAYIDDGVAEVNIKVSKPTGTAYRGVYIDGVRKSAGNTYKVSSTGTVQFDVTLKARYSGSYTLKVTNGSNVTTFPVYITGYNTLPQTGPDYSMVYIFAALLTVALGGIVLVNVLRKKDENIK